MKQFFILLFGLVVMLSYSQSKLTATQWQDDLKFLQQTVHSDYPFLFKKTTAEEFDAAVAKLHDQIPQLEDHEVVVGMAEIIALFKYGHTDISFRDEQFGFHYLPFNLYEFNDGIYIQGTHKDHAEALGAKVLEVHGTPIDKALELIYPVVNSENSQYFKAFGINYLRRPEVLHAKGILDELSKPLELTLEKNGKTFKHSFSAMPKGEHPPIKYSLIMQEGDWLEARDQSITPYYLKNLDKIYYFEYLPEHKAVYVRQSQIQDDPSEDIPTFYGRVFDFIENNDVEKLILDVRLNGGGNNFKNKPVVRGIIQTEKIDQVGKFFVIEGRRTFSACQNLVLELDNYTNAVFVGEPTSENVNFYGDNREVKLPNSGIPVYLSWAWWQDKPQWMDGPWHAPHLAVDMSFEQYYTNEDPMLDTALNFSNTDFILDPMGHMTNLFTTGQIEKLQEDAKKMVSDPAYKFFDFEGEFNKAGYNLLNSGRTQEAVFVFKMITDLFPNSANAWDSLAEGMWKAGDTEKAKALYQKAISMDPDGSVGENAKKMLAEIQNQN